MRGHGVLGEYMMKPCTCGATVEASLSLSCRIKNRLTLKKALPNGARVTSQPAAAVAYCGCDMSMVSWEMEGIMRKDMAYQRGK